MAWWWWILIGLGLLAGGVFLLLRLADPGPMAIPVSDHFNGERFTMPGGHLVGQKGLGDLLRWQWERKPAEWPKSVPVHPALPEARVEGGRIVATMVGHATVLVQTEGLNILTDPVWSERASPFRSIGPRRVTAPGIRFEELPKIDIVLVSHGHYDHLDLPTLRRLWQRDRPQIFVTLGHRALLARHGVEARELDWWQPVMVGPARLEAVPVQHWTSRWGPDANRALWAGWQMLLPGGSVYFAGDTGYGDGAFFREVRQRAEAAGSPVRLALLPVGAYEPRWFMAEQHMNPEEAVRALADLGAEQGLGMHWGTFQLTDEGRDAPAVALRAALDSAGIAHHRFPALEPGERVELNAR